MNISEKLEKIKVLLGLQVKFEADKLTDGTVLEAEAFEVGVPLFVINEDGTKTPAPAGSHETEGGKIIEVDEAGLITAISEKEEKTEIEIEVEPTEEVEMSEVELAEDEDKKMISGLFAAVEEMAKKISTMEAEMASMKEKYEAFSKLPGADKAPKLTPNREDKIDPIEARIEALNKLKKENFFKK